MFQVCVVSASLVQLSFVNENPGLTRNLHNLLCFFNPLYPLMGCLNCITKVGFQPGQPVSSFSGFSVSLFVFKPALSCILDNMIRAQGQESCSWSWTHWESTPTHQHLGEILCRLFMEGESLWNSCYSQAKSGKLGTIQSDPTIIHRHRTLC